MVGMARWWIEDGLAEVIHLGSNGELHAAPPRRPAVFPPRASPPASHGICPNLSLSVGFAAREAFLLPGAIRVRCGDGGEIGRRRARNRTAVDPEDRTQRSPGGRSALPICFPARAKSVGPLEIRVSYSPIEQRKTRKT